MTPEEKDARRKRINDTFVGKTISAIEAECINTWNFKFTDGTSQKMWAETAINTPYGGIPGILFPDEC